MSWGVFVQGVSVPGVSDKAVSVLGGNSQGVSVQGVSDRGVCVLGVSVQGVHVRGVLSCHHKIQPSKSSITQIAQGLHVERYNYYMQEKYTSLSPHWQHLAVDKKL